MITHFVSYDTPGKRLARALCGVLIHREDAADRPTCRACVRELVAEQSQTVEDVFGPPTVGTQVPSTLSDPIKGYTPKGTRS